MHANPSHGTKVTSDPQSQENPITEGAGVVTSDSLAAESDRRGGEFSENRNNEPLGVPSKSSTASNTDTSGAKVLEPAPDAETRGAQAAWQESSEPKGGRSTRSAGTTGDQGKDDGTTSGGSKVDIAPSYVTLDVLNPPVSAKPQGKNLTEGGFDSDDSKNASFNADIGSEDDPSRLAEGAFQRREAESGPDAGGGPRQSGVTGKGQYNELQSQEQV